MSFYGSSFSFDGISCEEYGLMLYDFDNTTQGNSKFASVDISEDRVYQRPRSLFYGTTYKNPLEFKLVFGADEYAAEQREPIDRQDMEVIGSWLTGHNSYKWLHIDQPDMAGIRYRCIITDLEVLEIGFDKWAFECTVHCDSPFAYTLPQSFSYKVDGTSNVVLHSRSSSNLPYFPTVTVQLQGSGDVEIVNHSVQDDRFAMSGIPQISDTLYIDGETGVIRAETGLNMYPYFNFKFPRLVRGDNHLTISGNCIVTYTCEFPVNVGG